MSRCPYITITTNGQIMNLLIFLLFGKTVKKDCTECP